MYRLRPSRDTRISIFSNVEHYAVSISTIGSCMPSLRLRCLDVSCAPGVHTHRERVRVGLQYVRSSGGRGDGMAKVLKCIAANRSLSQSLLLINNDRNGITCSSNCHTLEVTLVCEGIPLTVCLTQPCTGGPGYEFTMIWHFLCECTQLCS